jgi:alpha-galactosidase
MTAFFGCLGYELDPAKLTAEEKETVKKQVAFYKSHRKTFQYGVFSRLLSPRDTAFRRAAWMLKGEDECIVGVFKILSSPNQKPWRLRLTGLDPSALYDVSMWEDGGFDETDKALNCALRGGDELQNAGLLLDCAAPDKHKQGDLFSELFLLVKSD